MENYVRKIVKKAKENSFLISKLSPQKKNDILIRMADYLWENKDFILKENEKDIKRARELNFKKSFIDRLTLNEKR